MKIDPRIHNRVCRMMDQLGYAESTIGTRYIRTAVQIVTHEMRPMMCKHVYPGVAKEYGVTPAEVERAIRNATEKAQGSPMWDFEWKELGGWNKPTNSEVIMRLAREVMYREEELEK